MTNTRSIPESKLLEIKDNFKFFDQDNNHKIDITEFTQLLKIISPSATDQQAEAGFNMVDSNKDGYIDLEEFIAWWKTCWWEY